MNNETHLIIFHRDTKWKLKRNNKVIQKVGYNTYKQKYTKYRESFCIRDTGKYVARFSSNGGQRIVTVLIYLNDVVQGGQTSFPQLGLNMQPKQGRPLNDIIITLNDIIR